MNLSLLIDHGQSYWLDNLTRRMIRDGELARRVREEALGGVTSNPSIFHRATSTSRDYSGQICAETLAGRSAGPSMHRRRCASAIAANAARQACPSGASASRCLT